MSRTASGKSRVRMGRYRRALTTFGQYWKMKLRRLRVPAPLLSLASTLAGFFMLGLLMLSVVVIDVVSTLFLLCRKLLRLGRHHQGNTVTR